MSRQIYYHRAGDEFSAEEFGGQLESLIRQVQKNSQKEGVLYLCIGSDRSTGDSLGPLVGYKLGKYTKNAETVVGTLHQPVHAVNLRETMEMIETRYRKYVVVAIDASIGRQEHVGYITLGRGAIKPGLGVCKDLMEVGDIFITGIVGGGRTMEPLLLQSTRLSIVMELADCISAGIGCVEKFCVQASMI